MFPFTWVFLFQNVIYFLDSPHIQIGSSKGLNACDVMTKFVLSCMQYFAKLLTQNLLLLLLLLLLFAVHTGRWPSLHHQW